MSRVMEDAAATKQAGRAVGSPQWTAPEVLRGEAYNALADTYSFGMVLYEVRQSASLDVFWSTGTDGSKHSRG